MFNLLNAGSVLPQPVTTPYLQVKNRLIVFKLTCCYFCLYEILTTHHPSYLNPS